MLTSLYWEQNANNVKDGSLNPDICEKSTLEVFRNN